MKNDEWTGIKNILLMWFDEFERKFNKRFGWIFYNGRKQQNKD